MDNIMCLNNWHLYQPFSVPAASRTNGTSGYTRYGSTSTTSSFQQTQFFSVTRDYPEYLANGPATLSELEAIQNSSGSESKPEYPANSFALFEPWAPTSAPEIWKDILNPDPRLASLPNPWQQLYYDCAPDLNLTGTWTSVYGGHGREYIQVVQEGYRIVATKLRGDVNVPATKRTFEMTILKNSFGRIAIGRIHLAETGYRNPHWGFATLLIHGKEKFELTWYLMEDYLVTNTYDWSEDQNIQMGRPETELFDFFGLP
jgi:hypothetical protein